METTENYKLGYENGYYDATNGISLVVAIYSIIPGYSEGYIDGQRAWRLSDKI
jgi:hypothetical protein